MRFQNSFGLALAALGVVLREEEPEVVDHVLDLLAMGEVQRVDVRHQLLVDHIVFVLEVVLQELLQNLLDGQQIYLRIRTKPLEVLVQADEDPPPVGGELQLVLRLVDGLPVHLLPHLLRLLFRVLGFLQ